MLQKMLPVHVPLPLPLWLHNQRLVEVESTIHFMSIFPTLPISLSPSNLNGAADEKCPSLPSLPPSLVT